MNPREAMELKKKEAQEFFLPKEINIAVNLVHSFIKNNNIIGLKIAIILSGSRHLITYDKKNKVCFNVDELVSMCNIDRKTLSRNLKKITDTFFKFVDTNGDRVGTHPIHTYRYSIDNKKIFFTVSDEARSLFTELGKNKFQFTHAFSKNLMILKNKHSLRMQLLLELINSYSSKMGKRKKITLEDINDYFGTKYKRFIDIERKILKPVKEEITNANQLTFEYSFVSEPFGTGRPKITSVIIDLIDSKKILATLKKKKKLENKAPKIKEEE